MLSNLNKMAAVDMNLLPEVKEREPNIQNFACSQLYFLWF